MKNRILVVDDEESIRWVLSTSLEKQGYEVDLGVNGTEALEKAFSNNYSLIILDINMPDISGLTVLKELKEKDYKRPVVLITAQNTVNNAITGIKLGAYDYIAKPFDLDEVNRLVAKIITNFNQSENARKKKTTEITESGLNLGIIVGKSPEMLDIYKTVGRIADRDITVLITGESGTGKELIAQAIHSNSSRNEEKLVSVNISAIPKELIESELFGHEKGAFTGAQNAKKGRFEEADKGTLHIDEIGEMSADLQSKLLRVLEENKFYRLGSETPLEVDVRIVASTNCDLNTEIKNGNFREDLFYRLNAISINLPPLRNRKDDIPILLEFFSSKYAETFKIEKKIFSKETIQALIDYTWPGNVRELENTIKRVILLSPDKVINPEHLMEQAPHIIKGAAGRSGTSQEISDIVNNLVSNLDESSGNVYADIINKFEKQLLEIILDKTKGNKKKAAEILGMNRNTLAKKLTEFELN